MKYEVPRNQESKLRANKKLLKLVTNEHIIKVSKLLSVEYILIYISDSTTNYEYKKS
jgi:hypothetical protein